MRRIAALVVLTGLLATAAWANITLTTPIQQLSILGGTATTSYDTVRVTVISIDTTSNIITARIQILSSAVPSAPSLDGTYTVDPGTLRATLEVGTLRFQQSKTLTGAQAGAVATTVLGIKDQVETSAITFGLVAGAKE